MKKRIFIFMCILVISSIIITGCSQTAPTSNPATTSPGTATQPAKPASTDAPKSGERLVFFTLSTGTSTYASNVGLSQLINKYTNLNVTVQPYASPQMRWDNMSNGNCQLSTATAASAYSYIYGIPTPTEPGVMGRLPTPQGRILMGGNFLYYGWITRPDTGIKAMSDLKGRKVAGALPGQPNVSFCYSQTLAAYGIDGNKDVNFVPYDNPNAVVQGLIDGKVEAVFASLGGATMMEAATTKGAFAIPFPKEKRASINEAPDLLKLRDLPLNYLPNQKEAVSVIGTQNFFVCLASLSDESAYSMTKGVIEHAQELLSVSTEFKEWGVWDLIIPADFPVPYHPGAIKYFKEQGKWTPALETRQQENLAKIAKVPNTPVPSSK